MNTVGAKIKGLRELKKISLEEVSARSGLEVNQIQQIEDGNSIPSLSPMIKIARALGVRLGTFVDDSKELGPVVHRLADQADKGASFSSQNSGSSYLSNVAPASILPSVTFFSCVERYAGIFSNIADTFELYFLAAFRMSSL